MASPEFPKAYESDQYEDEIYSAWQASGFFRPENLPGDRSEPFTIVLPPPNVTGTLHMGHAAMLAIEDTMIRFARLRGKRALWIPGTDHAAVATEAKVEKLLIDEEGIEKPKQELGREKFLKRVEQFAQDSHDTIVNQVKKMGASVDWSREAYTLDDERNLAVRTAFKRMYEDGLIYRGYRVVNWSVKGQSTCSDDELVHVERPAKLYTFNYSKDVPITIATTRPETKLGDTAIAVHPDGKWKQYIGQTFTVENFGQEGHVLTLKVIGDEGIDDSFGTGALGVTTAHSPIDFEMYQKQKALGNDIGLIQVIGEDGKMTANAGSEYEGSSIEQARAKVVSWLEAEGLLLSTEDIMQNVGTSDRFKDVVEPLPKTQWFVDVNKEFEQNGKNVTLKNLMSEAVRGGDIQIMPDRFNKTYFSWIDNLRDWNISRQIWFGHRIPVWYQGDEMYVGIEAPLGAGWEQDPDTLDTWFSSGLWTFSTLGWPNEEAWNAQRAYHPTSVLETGYDIIFFWVARMILMSTYLIGEVPFKTVYLHGLIRDEEGRKMSKSLGNILDPLDMIKEYGADATRLSLLIGSTPGNDVKLSTEKIAAYRNFTNKLWNISRFVLTSVGEVKTVESVTAQTLADKWILSRFDSILAEVTGHLDAHEFSQAGEKLRDFTWNEFADWYLEIAKVQRQESGDKGQENTDKILLYLLERLLVLWHPYMPFVTEEIWKRFETDTMLIVHAWPEGLEAKDEEAEGSFNLLREVIVAMRNVRAEYKIAPSMEITAIVTGLNLASLEKEKEIIHRLARVKQLTIDSDAEKPEGAASVVVGETTIYIPLEGVVDRTKEKERLDKEYASTKAYVESLQTKLANTEFTSNAPEKVVEGMREKLADAEKTLAAIEVQRTSL